MLFLTVELLVFSELSRINEQAKLFARLSVAVKLRLTEVVAKIAASAGFPLHRPLRAAREAAPGSWRSPPEEHPRD